MIKTTGKNNLTAKDRVIERVFRIAPWLAPILFALPGPTLFLILYFMATTTEAAALFAFLSILSFGVGAVAGFLVAIILLFYRKRWIKNLREKLATDGVTADEVAWFTSEMTSAERQSLKQIESQNLLLADAYRETLAARLTASRVVGSAKRNLMLVERRLNRTTYMQGETNEQLQEELRADRVRLARIQQEGIERRSEAEARLQMIEAAASRGQSWTETNAALQRLNATQGEMPLALESARIDQQVREDVEKEMRRGDEKAST